MHLPLPRPCRLPAPIATPHRGRVWPRPHIAAPPRRNRTHAAPKRWVYGGAAGEETRGLSW
eukprot:365067-Chlamydomonas_euryale.AAC.2